MAEYDPSPCVKCTIQNAFIYTAHPIIKLRMLYIDMYMVEVKLRSTNPTNMEHIYQPKMTKAYDELLAFDKDPEWVGEYIDEAFENRKYNTSQKLSTPSTVSII